MAWDYMRKSNASEKQFHDLQTMESTLERHALFVEQQTNIDEN